MAIEADGPSHMSRTEGPGGSAVVLGATSMKARHLRALGWAVVNVSYREWDALPDEAARSVYLTKCISHAIARRGG